MRHQISIYCIIALLLAFISGCTDSPYIDSTSSVDSDGNMTLSFEAQLCEEQEVVTRAVDPDGKAIQSFWLFCFDEFGGYIGRSKASGYEIDGETVTSGKFSASIPAATRIIHFLANVNLQGFDDYEYLSASERYVISSFLANSGLLTYWARKTYNSGGVSTDGVSLVKLYRSQASVTVDSSTTDFIKSGFVVCNTWLSGTVAPFDKTATDLTQVFNWTPLNPFVTIPTGSVKSRQPTKVSTKEEQFIFEHANTTADPIFVIIQGTSKSIGTSKYYKLQLVDINKSFYPIYRNYRYAIHIKADLGPGYSTFSAAYNGTPVNNQFYNVDPTLPEIASDKESLLLKTGSTSVVITDQSTLTPVTVNGATYYKYDIPYSFTKLNGSGVSVATKLDDVNWELNDNIAADVDLVNDVTTNVISIKLKSLPTAQLQQIKLRVRGSILSRIVTIYIINSFKFDPVFISPKLSKSVGVGNIVTYTFNIPENYPTSLFPLDCKIMTKYLNPIESLPVIYENSSSGTGYKFVKQITAPGVVTMQFKNVVGNQSSGTIQIEANNFTTVASQFNYVDTVAGTPFAQLKANVSSILVKPIKNSLTSFVLTAVPNDSIYLNTSCQTLVTPAGITPTVVNGVKTYKFKVATATNTITLKSDQPLCNEVISIAAKNAKSMVLPISNSPNSYSFNLLINGSTNSNVSYQAGLTPIQLTFTIPQDSWQTGVNPVQFKYYIYCNNLDNVSIPSGARITPYQAGFIYEPATYGAQVLNFVTNKVVSEETISLLSNSSEIAYGTATVNYSNIPISGTIVYNSPAVNVPVDSFVSVENSTGIRVGMISIDAAGQYTLTFYADYALVVDGILYITYNNNGTRYQTKTSVQALIGNPTLSLVRI